MTYLLIVPVIVCVFLQQVADKLLVLKTEQPNSLRSRYLFCNAVASVLSVLLYGVLTGAYRTAIHWPTVGFGVVFGLSYCFAILLAAYLVQTGSFAFSSLIISFGPLIPTLFGLIVLSEPLKAHVLLGVLLLIVSLLCINLKKTERLRPLWMVLSIVAFVLNGLCSTLQTYHQTLYHSGGVLFMTTGTLVSLVVTGIYFAMTRQKTSRADTIVCMQCGAMRGVINIAVNFLVIYLVGVLPSSVLFPSVSAGGVVFSFLASWLIFKETMTLNQKIGFVIGLVSVVLLNL